MLSNILNTIFITLTMGSKVLQQPIKSETKIKKDTVSNNYNLSFGNEQYNYTKDFVDSYRETSYRTYKLNINKKVITNSYLNAEEITISQMVAGGNNSTNAYVSQQNVNNPKAIDTLSIYNGEASVYPGKWLYYSLTEQLKIIKINPNNNNINTYWNLTSELDFTGDDYGNSRTSKMYNEMITTIGNGLNDINITASSADDLWENIFQEGYTTCYRMFTQLRTNYSGYQSTYTRYITNLTDETTTENNFAIKITPNKTNYIILFRQPTFLTNETPEHNYYHTYDEKVFFGSYYSETINSISGTNVVASGSQEVIDIPGVMFNVLGMPFSFISVAFNLTLFPGTMYEINISTLFLSIFAVLVFVLIIKLLLKGFNK